jgi:hypothetical protein
VGNHCFSKGINCIISKIALMSKGTLVHEILQYAHKENIIRQWTEVAAKDTQWKEFDGTGSAADHDAVGPSHRQEYIIQINHPLLIEEIMSTHLSVLKEINEIWITLANPNTFAEKTSGTSGAVTLTVLNPRFVVLRVSLPKDIASTIMARQSSGVHEIHMEQWLYEAVAIRAADTSLMKKFTCHYKSIKVILLQFQPTANLTDKDTNSKFISFS